MNIEERIALWLHGDPHDRDDTESADLLNDAADELFTLREQLQALCDGVNRRCGEDNNQLPLVSLDRLTARLAEAEAAARWLWVRVDDDDNDSAWAYWPWLEEEAKGCTDA